MRVLITVRTQPGQLQDVERDSLERRLAEASRRWEDDLAAALHAALGEARAAPLYQRYANAFPAAYREDFPARAAVPDIELVERALATGEVAMNLYRPVDALPGQLRFKLVASGAPVTLSRALPMLERMGLTVIEERPYRIVREGGERTWLHDYGLATEAATSTSTTCARCSRRRSRASSAASSTATTSTAWCSRPGSRATRSSSCAPMRATCARSASRFRRRSSKRR